MKLKISNQCVCFYPIKIGIKKGNMNSMKKEKEKEKENEKRIDST